MSLTHERRTYECRIYGIDALGYLRCGACAGPDALTPGVVREVTRHDLSDDSEFALCCDGCRKHPRDWSAFTNTATAAIEHTPARIY